MKIQPTLELFGAKKLKLFIGLYIAEQIEYQQQSTMT